MSKKDLRGTWSQAFITFFAPIVLLFVIRWAMMEPFVIPSESMLPGLMTHDHLFVNKGIYGLRIPFTETFLLRWGHPERGDVIVFRYPENPDVFFIKRVIAVGGQTVEVINNQPIVDGQPAPQTLLDRKDDKYTFYTESVPGHDYTIQSVTARSAKADFPATKVPDGQLFVMGDNRDESHDSRFWGFVPENAVMGRASVIWLSCQETLPSAEFVCDPKTLRLERLFNLVR